jgi:hypothetical protein
LLNFVLTFFFYFTSAFLRLSSHFGLFLISSPFIFLVHKFQRQQVINPVRGRVGCKLHTRISRLSPGYAPVLYSISVLPWLRSHITPQNYTKLHDAVSRCVLL